MTNTLLHLQKKIPEQIVDILRHVSDASRSLDIKTFVIGATARDLIFEYVYGAKIRRKTEDVDFAIAVASWSEYGRLKRVLIDSDKFRDDLKQEQRIWWVGEPGEMRVDLVPNGGVEPKERKIHFPPTGDFAMSTMGFREVSENLLNLNITEDFAIDIISLAGLVLLKFVAYNDRPGMRKRDIQDIWFVAQNYLLAGNEERLYETSFGDGDLLDDDRFDYQIAGARLLGRDLGPLLNDETREIITKTLSEENDGGLIQQVADIISSKRINDDGEYEDIIKTLGELRRGVTEGLNKAEQSSR